MSPMMNATLTGHDFDITHDGQAVGIAMSAWHEDDSGRNERSWRFRDGVSLAEARSLIERKVARWRKEGVSEAALTGLASTAEDKLLALERREKQRAAR